MTSSAVNLTVANHLVSQTCYLEQVIHGVRTYKINFPKAEKSISALPLSEKRVTLLGPAPSDPKDPPQEVLVHLNELSAEEKAAGKISLWFCKEPLAKTLPKHLPEGFPHDWNGSPVGLDPRFGYLMLSK